ncbi:MAG: leucine-rich repeat domain-containing protein, partial [Muribaculaceae bacterium]|nr:leucine-rich repeat domain-containing protein [Muribaculaceae bacterium]
EYAFNYCANLTSIAIPEGVTSIETATFQGCSNLTTITIPKSVTSIREYAFNYCSSLTEVAIPEGVTSIGVHAFKACTNLTAITIPESVTSIGNYAFSYCNSLLSITIPEGVTSIGYGAFAYCSSLTEVTIPESVTSIGDGAFYECRKMTEIIVSPENSKYCSFNKSLYDKDLTTLIVVPAGYESDSYIIPEGVTSIGVYAFNNCANLISITIPEGVTSIGVHAFNNCTNLTAITIPEGVTSIEYGAFADCSSLTEVTIPEGVTSIGDYAFAYCSSLTTITIPEGVTSIGEGAFGNCSSLTSITIPEGVTTIGNWAFAYCSSLTEVYSLNPEAPIGMANSFEDIPYDAVLYVPKGSVEAYAAAEGWSVFTDIREIEEEVYSLTFNVVCDETPVEGAIVTVLDKEYITDENGLVEIAEIEGIEGTSLKFTVYKDGYELFEGEADFAEISEVVVDVNLQAAEATLTVKVFADAYPVEGALVTFEGREYISDESGTVTITGIYGPAVIGKTLPVTIYKEGYELFEGEADFTEMLEAYVVASLVNIQTSIRDIINDLENSDIKVYDLNGRRVMKPQNGQFYIINGQKVLLKL